MKMSRVLRVVSLVMVLVVCLSVFTTALAASANYTGNGSKTYTITTGKKDATLTVSQSAGKVTGTAWKNAIKKTTKTVTKSWYGKYQITVSNGSSSQTKTINYPFNKNLTFSLKKNSTYKVTVKYIGFSDQVDGVWNLKWKTYPKVKLSANNSAKIK